MSDSLFGLGGLQGAVLWGLRIAIALVVFVGVWFVSGPVWRGLYRLVFRQPVGGWLPLLRLGTSGLCAAGAFLFISFGGGGGWGFGPGGGGGGFGFGTGTGSGETSTDNGKEKRKGTQKKTRERLDIEILGGERYPGEAKYYLVGRKDPPMTLEEVEKTLQAKEEKLEVHIILTENSVGVGRGAESPLARLRERLNKHHIPNVEDRERPPE